MVRLAISVEGQTEERFVNRLLVPFFERKNIFATAILINGRGGEVSIERVRKDINKLANSFDKVTTIYDFYGFKGKDPADNKETLEEKILTSVSVALQHKVIPYIQMYEFESLVFASPEVLQRQLQGENLENWSKRVLNQFGHNPERINDSEQTAPSKRLMKKTNYIKTIHGPLICEDIGLDSLRTECAGFDSWVTQLEALT